MFLTTLLLALPLPPPLALPQQDGPRSGGSWSLLPFPDGGYVVDGPPFSLPTRPGGTGPGKGSTGSSAGTPPTRGEVPTNIGETPAAPPRAPLSPTPAPTVEPFAPANSPTDNVLLPGAPVSVTSAVFDLDGWTVWWRFHRERYLSVDPWDSAPVTGDAESRALAAGLSPEAIQRRIVPALVRALDDDPPDVVRDALLLSLARIGTGDGSTLTSSELHARLIEHLDDANQRTAETACISLGILASSSSLSTLSSLLLDTEAGRSLVGKHRVSRRVRAFAAYGIGLLGQRTTNPDVAAYATHALVSSLDTESGAAPDERVAALVALSMIDPSVRPMTRPAPSTTGGSANRSASTCACASNELLAARLLELFDAKGEDVRTRAHVPGALATLAPSMPAQAREDVAHELLDAMSRRSERDLVREGCVLALGRIGDADQDEIDAKIRKRLMKLSSAGDRRERTSALLALAQAGARPGLGNGDPRAGTAAVRKFLLKRLARARSYDRPWNALALGVLARELRDRGEVPAIETMEALRDGMRTSKSPGETAAHAIALGLCRDVDAVDDLAQEMEALAPATRADVAAALGMTGSPLAIEALESSLRSARHEPHVLENTARALALLQDPNVVPALERLADLCDCSLSLQGLALALGRTRHPDAASPLLARLEAKDASQLERAYAAIGLGYLADKDVTAWSYGISGALHYRAATSTLAGVAQGGILDLP